MRRRELVWDLKLAIGTVAVLLAFGYKATVDGASFSFGLVAGAVWVVFMLVVGFLGRRKSERR